MKLALIIGHSAKHQGAKLYSGHSEWSWHQDMIHKYLYSRLPLITDAFEIFWRRADLPYEEAMKDLAEQVSLFGASLVVELHVNAFNGVQVAKGCEFIWNNTEAHKFGAIWAKKMQNFYSIKLRNSNASRGKYNVEVMDCPAILLEPCFGDVEHRESRAIIEDPATYAALIAETIMEYSF